MVTSGIVSMLMVITETPASYCQDGWLRALQNQSVCTESKLEYAPTEEIDDYVELITFDDKYDCRTFLKVGIDMNGCIRWYIPRMVCGDDHQRCLNIAKGHFETMKIVV